VYKIQVQMRQVWVRLSAQMSQEWSKRVSAQMNQFWVRRWVFDPLEDLLVGGLEHFLFFHIYIGNNNPQLTNIFQRGWNHQPAAA
jgi:hypothetical protein